MTLLVDPALLWTAGYALGRRGEDEQSTKVASAILSGSVLALSVATYRDAPSMRPVWTALGGRSGRELILNSWVLRFDPGRRSRTRSAVIAGLFAAYPVWTELGRRRGLRARQGVR